MAAAALILYLGAWLLRRVRDDAMARQCECNLRQLGLALHNYHDTYKCLPAAYYLDQAGTPLHSWRIRVLPFVEQNTIFDAYRFDEPWDSPHNITLGQRQPEKFPGAPALGPPHCYFCPLHPELYDREQTSYAMIEGPGTALPVGQERRLDDFPDGVANTIIVAEIDHDRMHWLEPRDLHVDRMSFQINDPTRPSISSQHPRGPAVLFADGKVYRLAPNVPPSLVKALVTVDGGESIDRQRLLESGELR